MWKNHKFRQSLTKVINTDGEKLPNYTFVLTFLTGRNRRFIELKDFNFITLTNSKI